MSEVIYTFGPGKSKLSAQAILMTTEWRQTSGPVSYPTFTGEWFVIKQRYLDGETPEHHPRTEQELYMRILRRFPLIPRVQIRQERF